LLLVVFLCTCPALAAEPSADDIFNQLTSREWVAETKSKGVSAHTVVRFERNGTYSWYSSSDYVHRNDKGQWSFEYKEGVGVLRLSASGDLPFRIDKGQLLARWLPSKRGDKIEYGADDLTLMAKDLKPVQPTKEGQRLTKQAWVKINPFNDYGSPQQIEFMANQRYLATYRDGACTHGGTWSLLKESNGRWDLDSHADDNECDQRGGSAGLSHYYLSFAGDILLLGDGYAPADKKPKNSLFFFDRYGNSIQTRGEFAGDFVAGKPLQIDFTHTSADDSDYELVSFAVGLQKYKLGKGSYSTEGDAHWLVEKDLAKAKVTSSEPYSHRVEFKPPAAGEMGFLIRFKYANKWQPYDAQQSYLVTVK
jgi:hypothetical protein